MKKINPLVILFLGCTISGLSSSTCDPNSTATSDTGGLAQVLAFDRQDWDFIQNATTGEYTAAVLRPGATLPGASFYNIAFTDEEGQHTEQEDEGSCNPKWTHTVTITRPNLTDQAATLWHQNISQCICCKHPGFILIYNNGAINVMGERYVNGSPDEHNSFTITRGGSKGDSGKTKADKNTKTFVFKATFKRQLNNFTGGLSSLPII